MRLLGLICFFLLSFFFIPRLAQAEIKIALLLPLSGSSAVFGDQLRHGAEAAVEAVNAKGGVMGQKLQLVPYDDGCDPKQAVTAAGKAVADGLKFVIGHFCSGAGIAAAKVFMDEGVLLVSPAVSHPKFTDDAQTYVIRINARTPVQGQVIADYIMAKKPGARMAILHDKSSYGQMVAEAVQHALHEKGAHEYSFQSFTPGEKDYTALATQLKQDKADVVVVGGYHTEAGLLARQMAQMGARPLVLGGMALLTRELVSIAGDAVDNIRFSFGPDMRSSPRARDAVAAMRAKGFEPEGFTIYAYAAAEALAQAIEAAQSLEPKKVALQFRTGTYKTVLGDLAFNEKGDVDRPAMSMYRWNGKDFEEEK